MFHSSQNENTFHSLLFAEYSHARNLPDVNVHVQVKRPGTYPLPTSSKNRSIRFAEIGY